ncbi:hypothetical protein ACFYPT_42415 [Streptomyces sp. NPDC005529]|uniref:hypothetical protein n=1 Tax=unclassified Streptomyces TaxID=2593676 RepID=UPI0033B1C907
MNSAPRNPLAGTAFETRILRGVGCVRLSVLTDEVTSPELRQREVDDAMAAELNIDFGEGEVLCEAVDLGVSAIRIVPFDRSALGGWL